MLDRLTTAIPCGSAADFGFPLSRPQAKVAKYAHALYVCLFRCVSGAMMIGSLLRDTPLTSHSTRCSPPAIGAPSMLLLNVPLAAAAGGKVADKVAASTPPTPSSLSLSLLESWPLRMLKPLLVNTMGRGLSPEQRASFFYRFGPTEEVRRVASQCVFFFRRAQAARVLCARV